MLGSLPMAAVQPFRALRYDEAEAGPARRLVAPPYDVIDDGAARASTSRRSPYNVVHLTLPDSRGGRRRATLAGWRERGRAARGRARALVRSRRTTSAPTASRGRATGLVGSLEAKPYENGAVLPHERTHAGPKEGRLRLLRATRDAARADLPALRRRRRSTAARARARPDVGGRQRSGGSATDAGRASPTRSS